METALVIVGIVAVLGLGVWWAITNGGPKPPEVLEPGWQLHPRPTTLEGVGTVFRVDDKGRRYPVTTLEVASKVGPVAQGRHHVLSAAHMGMIARLVGLGGVNVSAARTHSLVFDLDQPTREYVEDAELDRVLLSRAIARRPGDRYFVIRASLSALGVTYRLEDEVVQDLGGKAKLTEAAELAGTLHESKKSGTFTLDQRFETPYHIMFLPEELRSPESEGAPALAQHDKVNKPLEWKDSRQTDLDFVLDELLIPLARRLGRPWLASVQAQVATALPSPLLRLAEDAGTETAEGSPAALRAARTELATYVQRNPGFERDLGRIARHVTVASGPDAEGDEDVKRLEGYWAKLDFVFDRVDRLGQPVALRGFFNSVLCVTVVDCRAEHGSFTALEHPRRTWSAANDVPKIQLAYFADIVHELTGFGMPRVWIIRTESDRERDDLAAELTRQFSRPPERVPDPRFFDKELPSTPHAELVSSITKGVVHIAGPRPELREPAETREERIEQLLAAPTVKDPRDDDPFYEIDTPDGINLLRDDLERQLRDHWERGLEWP